MAVYYLRHPKHGYKVAGGDLEAQMDRANGWVDCDPYKDVEAKKNVPAFLVAPSDPPKQEVKPEKATPKGTQPKG